MNERAERFWAGVDRRGADECWEWLEGKASGYGRFWNGERTIPAHRFAYELVVGPISPALTIDHLCRNHSCVNPAHLEAVTVGENVMRGVSPVALHARQTGCKHGHPFDEDNTLTDKRGHRRCRVCQNASWLRHHRRKMSARQALVQTKEENDRLTDMHRKAVAEAAILLAEKTDRDEEIERLRKTGAEAKESVLTSLNLVDDASSTLRISWQKLLLAQTTKCRPGADPTDAHRKAVAEAVILTEEKADRDEEIERLRGALKTTEYAASGDVGEPSYCVVCEMYEGHGHTDSCVVGQALAQSKKALAETKAAPVMEAQKMRWSFETEEEVEERGRA